jgi:ELWxxDGT repeat protein
MAFHGEFARKRGRGGTLHDHAGSRRRRFGFEPLERRDLLAVSVELLRDITTETAASEPENVALADDSFYFSGIVTWRPLPNPLTYALFKSDGTTSGTYRVSVLPDRPVAIGNVNGTAFFSVDHPDTGVELWISDGTEEGTRLLRDIIPGPTGSRPGYFASYDDQALFIVHAANGTPELWKSDGTEGGTVKLADNVWNINSPTVNNGALLFLSRGALWRTDGTSVGTYSLAPAGPVEVAHPAQLPVIDGKVYFIGRGDLFQTDGTITGTTQMPVDFGVIVGFFGTENALYVVEYQTNDWQKVWKTDGTANGTSLVTTFGPFSSTRLFDGDDSVFINGDGSSGGLFSFSQTTGALERVANDNDNDNSLLNVENAISFRGELYWGSYNKLYRSDGTTAGTGLFMKLAPHGSLFDPKDFFVFNDHLYFVTDDRLHGQEVWRSDGTVAGTRLFFDANTATIDSRLTRNFATSGGKLLFTASNGGNSSEPLPGSIGEELYVSDGTPAGTRLVRDVYPGPESSAPRFLTDVDGTLFFYTSTGLWKSDGTESGTMMVKEYAPNTQVLTLPAPVSFKGQLYFAWDDGIHGRELWRTDGSGAGTVMVKDIRTSGGSEPHGFIVLGDSLLFLVNSENNQTELWRADGTVEGTKRVFTFDNDLNLRFGGHVVAARDKVFLLAKLSTDHSQLWVTDGTADGTQLLRGLSEIEDLVATGDRVFLSGGFFGQIWISDGTVSGTVPLRDIAPHAPTAVENLTVVGDEVYFLHTTPLELWRTNGTATGTAKVAGLPGMKFEPRRITAATRDTFYMLGVTAGALELWKSNGTERTTQVVATFAAPQGNPGWLESLFVFDGAAYFPGTDGAFGLEPRKVEVSASTPSISGSTTRAGIPTTSGLVVSRNAADGSEVSYVKVTDIVGGNLYFDDGLTEVRIGQFVPFETAARGFMFLPDLGFSGTGTVQIQASTSPTDAGLGGQVVTAKVTVLPGLGTPGDDNLAIRSNSDGTMLELFLGKPPAPGAAPDFQWPMSANVPLPLEMLSGHDIITVELPPGTNGPAAGIQLDAGSGFNRLLINGGKVRMDSVAVGGTLDVVVNNGAELTTNRFDQVSLALLGAGSKATLLPNGETSIVTRLAIDQNSIFDITDNAIVVDYVGPSPLAMIRVRTLFGRGGTGVGNSTWTGAGIISSTAAAENSMEPEKWSVGYAENAALPLGAYTTFRGVAVDETAVLIAYTRTGDANLDGAVDNDDVTIVGASYAPGVAKPHWAMGDFDYNSFVDDDDVTLLGAFYQPGAAAAAPPLPLSSEAAIDGSLAAASPEIVRVAPAGSPSFQAPSFPVSLSLSLRVSLSSPVLPSVGARRGVVDQARTRLADDEAVIDLLAESIAAKAVRDDSLADARLATSPPARESHFFWPN